MPLKGGIELVWCSGVGLVNGGAAVACVPVGSVGSELIDIGELTAVPQ